MGPVQVPSIIIYIYGLSATLSAWLARLIERHGLWSGQPPVHRGQSWRGWGEVEVELSGVEVSEVELSGVELSEVELSLSARGSV